MKKIFIYSFLALIFSSSAQAQRCDKYNKYCDAEFYDFDYSVQSAFSHLMPGDTVPIKTVLYSNKEYHITACSDYPNLEWWITKPYRRTERTLVDVRNDTILTYKTDEYGENIWDDETGDYVIEDMEITVDTIWNTKRIADEKLIFRKSSSKVDWKKNLKKTQRAFIYVVLPMDADPDGACVAVFIGRNASSKAKFGKGKASGNYY